MAELIAFATRIDKGLKEKVIEFSKENKISVQNIIEKSLKETLNNEVFKLTETQLFLQNKIKIFKNEGYFKAEEFICELDDFLTKNNIKLPHHINESLVEFLEIKSKIDNVIDLY